MTLLKFYRVLAKKDITAGQDVFLIDHAFSFRYPELRTALTQNQHVKDRLSSMLTFADTKRPHPQYPKKTQENVSNLKYLFLILSSRKISQSLNSITKKLKIPLLLKFLKTLLDLVSGEITSLILRNLSK